MKLAPSNDVARIRRRTLIDIALRRQRAGTGSLVRETPQQPWTRWPDLAAVLGDIPWAVTCGVATRLYMSERMTRDLDVLIRALDADRADQSLTRAGFTFVGRIAIGGSTWVAPDGTPVDVLEGEDAWVDAALAQARENRDAQGLPVLPLAYQVLMKLAASRVQDLADVTRMLGRAGDHTLDQVRAVVRAHAPELAEDLESLILLGKLELEEPGR